MTEIKIADDPHVISDCKGIEFVVFDYGNSRVTINGSFAKENAANIVKCVNMHDELVDALKKLRMSVSGECYIGDEKELAIIEEALKKSGAL